MYMLPIAAARSDQRGQFPDASRRVGASALRAAHLGQSNVACRGAHHHSNSVEEAIAITSASEKPRAEAPGCAACCAPQMFPAWLHALSIVALLLGGACALFLVVDIVARPQRMAVMNVVWPVTALFGTVFVVWLYLENGREPNHAVEDTGASHASDSSRAFSAIVAKGALHCGAGCMIGDVVAEWLAFAVPGVAAWLGWHTLFAEKIFAVWLLDFAFAFVLGIVFQYLAIAPMRHLSFTKGLIAALKADTLSLASWQVGMYGFMALAQFGWFEHAFHTRAEVDMPEFWFAMQLAMLAGLTTAFPVNWWLIRAGIKESM